MQIRTGIDHRSHLQLMLDCASVIPAIVEKRKALSPERALLVGISGIDAAGKGFVTARIAELLEKRGIRPAVINIDGWLNLPDVRFHSHDRGKRLKRSIFRRSKFILRAIIHARRPTTFSEMIICSRWRSPRPTGLTASGYSRFATNTAVCAAKQRNKSNKTPVAMICTFTSPRARVNSAIPSCESQTHALPARQCRSDVAAIPMITSIIPAVAAQMTLCS